MIFYRAFHLYAVFWEPPFYNYTVQTGKGWVMAFYLRSQYANVFRGLCIWGPVCLWGSPSLITVLEHQDLLNRVYWGLARAEFLTLSLDKIKNFTTLNIKAISVLLPSWPHAMYFKMKTKLHCKINIKKSNRVLIFTMVTKTIPFFSYQTWNSSFLFFPLVSVLVIDLNLTYRSSACS